jgi:RND family efflux transporter MFP subunit
VLTSGQAEAFGVATTEVQPGAFEMSIKAGGEIQSAQGDMQILAAPVSGIVSFVRPLTEGAPVAKNETLLSISSRNIAEGDPADRTRLEYETAERAYRRAEALIKDTLISRSEFEQAQLGYQTAKVAYEALSVRRTASGGTRVSAGSGGYVNNRLVGEGEYVVTGQPLLTVTQSRRLYLSADVPEKYFSQLSGVTSANFKTPYADELYRLSDLNGRLVSYGRITGKSSYVPVLFEFDNTGRFAPGAYVEVYLLVGVAREVITLPLNAVIEEQGLYFVFKQVNADSYRKQEVKIGHDNGAEVCILEGVATGDRIVTQGTLRVKLVANSSSLPEHSH